MNSIDVLLTTRLLFEMAYFSPLFEITFFLICEQRKISSSERCVMREVGSYFCYWNYDVKITLIFCQRLWRTFVPRHVCSKESESGVCQYLRENAIIGVGVHQWTPAKRVGYYHSILQPNNMTMSAIINSPSLHRSFF